MLIKIRDSSDHIWAGLWDESQTNSDSECLSPLQALTPALLPLQPPVHRTSVALSQRHSTLTVV